MSINQEPVTCSDVTTHVLVSWRPWPDRVRWTRRTCRCRSRSLAGFWCRGWERVCSVRRRTQSPRTAPSRSAARGPPSPRTPSPWDKLWRGTAVVFCRPTTGAVLLWESRFRVWLKHGNKHSSWQTTLQLLLHTAASYTALSASSTAGRSAWRHSSLRTGTRHRSAASRCQVAETRLPSQSLHKKSRAKMVILLLKCSCTDAFGAVVLRRRLTRGTSWCAGEALPAPGTGARLGRPRRLSGRPSCRRCEAALCEKHNPFIITGGINNLMQPDGVNTHLSRAASPTSSWRGSCSLGTRTDPGRSCWRCWWSGSTRGATACPLCSGCPGATSSSSARSSAESFLPTSSSTQPVKTPAFSIRCMTSLWWNFIDVISVGSLRLCRRETMGHHQNRIYVASSLSAYRSSCHRGSRSETHIDAAVFKSFAIFLTVGMWRAAKMLSCKWSCDPFSRNLS